MFMSTLLFCVSNATLQPYLKAWHSRCCKDIPVIVLCSPTSHRDRDITTIVINWTILDANYSLTDIVRVAAPQRNTPARYPNSNTDPSNRFSYHRFVEIPDRLREHLIDQYNAIHWLPHLHWMRSDVCLNFDKDIHTIATAECISSLDSQGPICSLDMVI